MIASSSTGWYISSGQQHSSIQRGPASCALNEMASCHAHPSLHPAFSLPGRPQAWLCASGTIPLCPKVFWNLPGHPAAWKPQAVCQQLYTPSWPKANFNTECPVSILFTLLTLPHPKVRPFILLFCFGSISTNSLSGDNMIHQKKKRLMQQAEIWFQLLHQLAVMPEMPSFPLQPKFPPL